VGGAVKVALAGTDRAVREELMRRWDGLWVFVTVEGMEPLCGAHLDRAGDVSAAGVVAAGVRGGCGGSASGGSACAEAGADPLNGYVVEPFLTTRSE
jgi:hypothetical protein